MYRTTKAQIRRRTAVVVVIAAGALTLGGVATMAGASPRSGTLSHFGGHLGPDPRRGVTRVGGPSVLGVTPGLDVRAS